MKSLTINLIRRYRKLGGGRTLLNCQCNFTPSCSEYAIQSIEQFGMLRGSILALRRLKRCNVRDQTVVTSDPIPELSGKKSHVAA